MIRMDATTGANGMLALLRAFTRASQDFQIGVMLATAEGSNEYHLLFTIDDTTAALTFGETEWLAGQLVDCPFDRDLRQLGRVMFKTLADAPGTYGIH